MKKAIALISAAILIFGAAGCGNKQPADEAPTAEKTAAEQTEGTTPIPEETSDETECATEKESRSTEKPTSPTAVVIVTGGKEYGIQQPDVTSVMQIVTTIAPQKPRPTVTTARHTTAKSTTAKPQNTTARPQTTYTTAPKPTTKETTTKKAIEPTVLYGSGFSEGEGENRDTVKIISHTCTLRENGTFGIVLTLNIEEYSGTRDTMFIGYNCYDGGGKLLNETPKKCLVSLNEDGKRAIAITVVPEETAKVEFVNL